MGTKHTPTIAIIKYLFIIIHIKILCMCACVSGVRYDLSIKCTNWYVRWITFSIFNGWLRMVPFLAFRFPPPLVAIWHVPPWEYRYSSSVEEAFSSPTERTATRSSAAACRTTTVVSVRSHLRSIFSVFIIFLVVSLLRVFSNSYSDAVHFRSKQSFELSRFGDVVHDR